MFSIDKISEKIAAFGVPGLIFLVSYGLSGLTGAAGITSALAFIGPGGMVGGLVILLAAGILSECFAKYGFRSIAKRVVRKLLKKGESRESIIDKVNNYEFISKDMKLYIKDLLENIKDIEEEN